MKICILNPFLLPGKLGKLSRKRQPLCLAYIASLLRDKHEIKLLDANVLNLVLEEAVKEIKAFAPEILILTSAPVDRWECPSCVDIKFLMNILTKIIDRSGARYTILTGSHGAVMPEWILQKSQVNFVVRNEPELVTLELVTALSQGAQDFSQIKGISYLENDTVINNPHAERIRNLDDMPFPAYDLLPMDKYHYTSADIPSPFSIMMTSRGCPFNCVYCLKVMMKKFYYSRSPENIVAEIKYLLDNFGIQGIYFQDWEFVINKFRVTDICNLIRKNNLQFRWGCNARATDIDDDIVRIMKEAGCVRINIGFESGSQEVLDKANKQIKISDIKNTIDICRKYSINLGLYSILNLPGENKKTIRETEKFLADNGLKTISGSNLPIPYFGTELYEMLKKQEGREFSWEELKKFAGRINVGQAPWLAKVYHWHYKYTFNIGKFYFFNWKFYKQLFKYFGNFIPVKKI